MSAWLKDICGAGWRDLLLHSPKRGAAGAEEKGAPSVMIITTSGARACDIYRLPFKALLLCDVAVLIAFFLLPV